MKLLHAVRKPENSARKLRYRKLSLVKLIEKIVTRSDRLALKEFHNNRTLFTYQGRRPMLFIDYLNELRESTARQTWIASNSLEVAERAYDLTMDKFNNLPSRAKNKISPINPKGPDCRKNFEAFLNYIAQSFKTEPPANEIEEEARAAMIMQGLVRRHFYLSLLEAKRKANPFWSRYYWKVRGHSICVWLPVSLRGRERREWLEKNIDKPAPRRPDELERIQSIIDSNFPRESFTPLDEAKHLPKEEELSLWSDSGKAFGVSLAEMVAEEKARNISFQPPSIRTLGKQRLKRLILRIFNDLSSDQYEDGKIARKFKLSKATFSRFAGSRWLLTESTIPKLWLNTAEVLSKNPVLREVAIGAGIWKKVQSTLERGAPPCEEETSHDQ